MAAAAAAAALPPSYVVNLASPAALAMSSAVREDPSGCRSCTREISARTARRGRCRPGAAGPSERPGQSGSWRSPWLQGMIAVAATVPVGGSLRRAAPAVCGIQHPRGTFWLPCPVEPPVLTGYGTCHQSDHSPEMFAGVPAEALNSMPSPFRQQCGSAIWASRSLSAGPALAYAACIGIGIANPAQPCRHRAAGRAPCGRTPACERAPAARDS